MEAAHRSYHLLLAATWIVLACLAIATGNRGATVGLGSGVGWSDYVLGQFPAIARYLRLAIWPAPLVFDYGTGWTSYLGSPVPGMAVVTALITATIHGLRKRPALGFLGVWFFAILAPTSLLPGNRQTLAEHRTCTWR